MKTLFVIALFVISGGAVCAGQVVTVDFDDLPEGSYYIPLNHYPGLWYVDGFLGTGPSEAHSSPNLAFDVREIAFSQGAVWVSVYTRGTPGIGASGVGPAHEPLGYVDVPGSLNEWHRTDLHFDAPIGVIGFRDWHQEFAYVDDLSYEIVPEPASLLSLCGLLGLTAGTVRRRRV